MNCGDCDKVEGESDDTTEFVNSLSSFKLKDTKLDQQATGDLVERCLAKFDDPETSLECRAISLYAVVAQITSGNSLMLAYIPDICQRLQTSSVLSQTTIGAGAGDYHREIINAISVVLDAAPEKLVNESFRPVLLYLVRLVSCEDVGIAILACDFWGKYAAVPAIALVRRHWMSSFMPELPTLIAALMEQMMYRPAHVEVLKQFSSCCSNPEEVDKSHHNDVILLANLRNLAALAFENIANVYPSDMICATFRPLLESRIESDSWLEKEAAILALAAFTEGTGTPESMRDCYTLVVPRIIDCYSDPRPLMRSIACFVMPKLVGHRLRGLKDPWPRVLTCTAKATRDSCPEVRNMATRALSALLAYGTGCSKAAQSAGISSHTSRLVDSLVRAGQCEMDAEARCAYFECVSHLVGRASDSLSPADMERLIPPLIQAWKSQPWDRAMDGESSSSVEDPKLTIVPFSVALVRVASHGRTLFAPYAEEVFEKACSDLEEIVKTTAAAAAAASSGGDNNDDDANDAGRLSRATMSHMICCLDLLSATYDGLADSAATYASKFNLLALLHSTLTTHFVDQRVYVSSFALLSHVLANESGPTDPSVDEFLDIISSTLERPRTANKARGNALLALVHAVANPSASTERLLGFVERLIEIFMRIEDDSGCIINAAWALTNICAPRATEQALIDVVTRSDVFLHLAGLLRAEFPRSTEKLAIFKNVIRMISPAIDKVPEEVWPSFLTTVVSDEQATMADASDLHVSLRALLREIRSTLGSAGWTKALLEMGAQPAALLRRRYKLF